MKTYEIVGDEVDGKMLKATEGDKTLWIPLDPANSDYAEYLRYTAWVEAGNTPEDFWKQSDELIEPSKPKEEETTEQPSSTDTKIETDLGE